MLGYQGDMRATEARKSQDLPLGRGVELGDDACAQSYKAEVAANSHPPGNAVGQEHIFRQTPLIFSLSHNPTLWWSANCASTCIVYNMFGGPCTFQEPVIELLANALSVQQVVGQQQ